MARASFLLRPRWILSHLFVAALVVTMVNLGFWQLDRLEQRRERNDLIRDRQAEAPVAVGQLLAPGDGPEEADAVRFRAVTAAGTYDEDATVVVRNRTLDGVPGVWLLTPLVLDSGDGAGGAGGAGAGTGDRVGVVRGFVALGAAEDVDGQGAPDGQVTVSGVVVSPDGLDGTASQDVEPLLGQEGMLPGLVMAESSVPPEPAAGGPTATLHPVPLPDLEEGPHFSYAMQWFIFSAIAMVGYPLVLRRLVQRRGRGDSPLEQDAKARANGTKSRPDEELVP